MTSLKPFVQVCLALTLLTPLVATPLHFVYGFVVPRVLFLRAVVLVMLGAWVVLALHSRAERRALRSPVALCGAAYLAALVAAALAGVDLHRSVWDTYERMLGLVTLLHFAALYVVAASALQSWEAWRRLLWLVLAVGVVVAGVAIAQKVDPLLFGNAGSPRVGSTLGHPTYLGAHGAFVAAVAALLVAREERKAARLWAAAAGGLAVLSVLLSETRGTLLGLAGGVAVALGAYSLALPAGRGRRWARGSLAAAGLLALGALPLLGLEPEILRLEHELARDRAGAFLRWHERGTDAAREPSLVLAELGRRDDAALAPTLAELGEVAAPLSLSAEDLRGLDPALLTAENRARPIPGDDGRERELARKRAVYSVAYSVPGLRRFARATVTKKTATTRRLNWEAALDAARERPLLGWGPNNYFHAHNRHYRPELLAYGFQATWIDDAHNVLLNTLAEVGAVGLLAYLALLGVPVVVLWRSTRCGRVDVHTATIVTAYLAARLVHNAFVFENTTSYLDLVLVLAFVTWRTGPESTPSPAEAKLSWLRTAPVLALAGVGVWLLAVQPARVARALDEPRECLLRGELAAAERVFEAYLDHASPHADEGRHLVALDVAAAGNELVALRGQARTPEQVAFVADAVRAYEPLARRAFDELGEVLARREREVRVAVGRAVLADQISALVGDRAPLAEAERELGRAQRFSPLRQELMVLRARARMVLQRPPTEVFPLLEEARDAAPSVARCWLGLAEAHLVGGNAGEARRVVEEALAAGVAFGPEDRAFVDELLAGGPR